MENTSPKKKSSSSSRRSTQERQPRSHGSSQSSRHGGHSGNGKRHKKGKPPKTNADEHSVDDYQDDTQQSPNLPFTNFLEDVAASYPVNPATDDLDGDYTSVLADHWHSMSVSFTDSMNANQGSGAESSSPIIEEGFDVVVTSDDGPLIEHTTTFNGDPNDSAGFNAAGQDLSVYVSDWRGNDDHPPWNQFALRSPRSSQDIQALFRSTEDLLSGDKASRNLRRPK